MLGSLVGFFWFNRYPARIFMGDTGSLALGALLGGVAVEAHALLLLPLFGIIFVIEALSVIAQVASFKSTGRRIFKMSPLHHHFELSGWRETAVTSTFIAVRDGGRSRDLGRLVVDANPAVAPTRNRLIRPRITCRPRRMYNKNDSIIVIGIGRSGLRPHACFASAACRRRLRR